MAEPSEGSGLRKLQLQQDDDDDYGYADGDVAFSHNNRPAPYCYAVECGGVYTDKVSLNDDLGCDRWREIGDSTIQDSNCALTLEGPGAELDCNGYTVYQDLSTQDIPLPQVTQRARNCPNKLGSPEEIEAMKTECGMYYVAGVCLKNGASLKNCGIERYFHGVRVTNSAKIEHSTMTQNTIGLRVNDDQAGDKTKVSYT